MPNYLYKCQDCKKTFEVHMRVEDMSKQPAPQCMHCGGKNVKRVYSGVSVVTSKKS